ncbi:endonuclease iii : Endonuclease III OS=Synechococcus sp. (strain JA-3-3Ab) GN=nth PE=3 SV=1: HhH-GPD: HHH: EndIII_4Fe-2S [Gemmata massiliana]|uniref:Endonuclease III n=1 Tax=Gemmata massiliana TaxID=1210884 RepID=A0A6P2DGX8_9BACT|nr:endonuclease III [Gemmata massiliana]VTS01080.1 endonuclease iii : Endonuclease III OS=Synechococcus sp. (strain JA-3-3Ab) GN=nth PE=3 SV=1: HhH-GPD: HHH: EndIII_4Fe-2S [Gemmata massiliana]
MDDLTSVPKLPPARDRVVPINDRLAPLYPEFEGLNYENPFQLLVAVILSAQCTDKRVNLLTPALFARFPSAHELAECDIKELEQLVKPSGFYKNKAKNIRACCVEMVLRFGGQVPTNLDDLVTLPGVGRKTANVILGHAFETPGVTVDTHVGRLSRRLGLTRHRDPVKVELALAEIVPQAEWLHFSGRLIMHGRKVCLSRKPRCEQCVIADLCPKIGVKGLAEKRKRKKGAKTDSPPGTQRAPRKSARK